MLEGGCYCNRTRFTVKSVFDCIYCHCDECRKQSGAPVFASVAVSSANFTLTGAEPKAFARENGSHYFCDVCGSALYYQSPASPYVFVALGAFDTPGDIEPLAHQFWPQRLPWLHIEDDLPKFDGNNLSHPDKRHRS